MSKTIEAAADRSARDLGGWDFFLLWAGAAIALPEIWAGGLLGPLGLAGGLAAIVLGHVIGNTPMALGGLIGSRHDVPAMISTRGALGVRGSHLPAVLNVTQLVGWTAVMVWIGGHAAARLAAPWSSLPTPVWLVATGALATFWSLIGRRYWRWMQRLGVLLLLALSVVLTVVVIRRYGLARLAAARPEGPALPFMLGLDLVIAMPVSWLPLVSDYARRARAPRACFAGTWWGYLLASSWMYAIGLCAALATGTEAPDEMVLSLMASAGLALPALLIVLLSTFTTTFLDIFSTAESARSLLPRADRRVLVLVGGALGTGLALVVPVTQYENFLLFIGSFFCPLFGVVLADYFLLKRGRYERAALYGRGPYWYRAGINPAAVAAWAAGVALYQWSARAGWPTGASVPSMLGAAALYLGLVAVRGGKKSTGSSQP